MSKESAAAYKIASQNETPEFKEVPANDNFELPTSANDNYELAQETPLEVDDERIDEVRERLGLNAPEASNSEEAQENQPAAAHPEAAGAGTPEGPEDGGGDGHDGGHGNNGGNTGGGSNAGGHGGSRVEHAKEWMNSHGHGGDWMNVWPGKGLIWLLAGGFMIWDFIKNTRWGDAFKTKGGGGGGGSHGGGGHGGGHGGGGGHH